MLYHSEEAGRYVFLLAPVTPLMYLDTAVDGVLKGLGLQTASMRINILDAALSLFFTWTLIPRWGVKGYLFILYFSETLNFLLSYRRLRLSAGIRVSFYKSVLCPLLACVGAVCVPGMLLPGFFRTHPVACLIPAAGTYLALLTLLGAVSRRDWRVLFPNKKAAA